MAGARIVAGKACSVAKVGAIPCPLARVGAVIDEIANLLTTARPGTASSRTRLQCAKAAVYDGGPGQRAKTRRGDRFSRATKFTAGIGIFPILFLKKIGRSSISS
jgi:hypothetical protein